MIRLFLFKIKIMESNSKANNIINMTEFSTPLGPMLAGATFEGVCILEFTNRIKLEKEITELQNLLNAVPVQGRNQHLDQLELELKEYFDGKRKTFEVPLHTPGNDFTQSVWKTLQEIPYGQTCSYKEQADKMSNPKAIRAIATTNGRNRLAIVIPCHRVIGSNGSMTGYAAGIDKKKWLLKFERENSEIPDGNLFK
jgi:AraC family transcriptional regulator of adaptative response/methylated-DNA-[protein]-cysteine methyltransferase